MSGFKPLPLWDLVLWCLLSLLFVALFIWWLQIFHYRGANAEPEAAEKNRAAPAQPPQRRESVTAQTVVTQSASTEIESSQRASRKGEDLEETASGCRQDEQADKPITISAALRNYLLAFFAIQLVSNLYIPLATYPFFSYAVGCSVFHAYSPQMIIGRLCLYLFYLERTRLVFNDTPYGFPKRSFRAVVTMMTLGHVLVCVVFVSVMVPTECFWGYGKQYWYHAIALGAVNDMATTIWCCACFTKKVNAIVTMMEATTASAPYAYKDRQQLEAIRSMRTVMLKVTVLSYVTVITTAITFMISRWMYFMICFDNLFNAVCMLLSFSFMNRAYVTLCIWPQKLLLRCIDSGHGKEPHEGLSTPPSPCKNVVIKASVGSESQMSVV